MESIRLRSVNWEHGMLLTPDHFLRQEHYLESIFFWGVRYLTKGNGLIGGGVRVPEGDQGVVRFDPVIYLDENSETLSISVSQARGLSPSGCIVDIDEAMPISARFQKEALAGVSETEVFVVVDSARRIKIDGANDDYNPQMKSERAISCRVALAVTPAEREDALVVGRIRRQRSGAQFEKDASFIPPCMVLSAHSELIAGWRRILESLSQLSQGYSELHRAMREFIVLFTERGIETELDRDAQQFAERMVLALEETIYGVLDRSQSPQEYFAKLRRFLRQAATFFDLAPNMQQYYETLRETGETELVSLIEGQRRHHEVTRSLRLNKDLSLEIQSVAQSLTALEKLERALEGKYIDFRISPSLDSMNFIFDRGGKVLYKMAAKPSRVQGVADELSIYFSKLRLEGRDRYRLILIGERDSPFTRGTPMSVEIRLNEGTGFRREAIILSSEAKLDEQYNFEFDFEAPDVPTITDVRVTVQAYQPIRTATLFIRHRFYAGRAAESQSARPIEVTHEPVPPQPEPLASAGMWSSGQSEKDFAIDLQSMPLAGVRWNSDSQEVQPKRDSALPPWSPRDRESRPASPNGNNDEPLTRPRRRRLE